MNGFSSKPLRKLAVAASVAVLATFWAVTGASAGDYDGTKNLLCAPTEVSECIAGSDCMRSTATAANLPNFIGVNFRKKVLSGANADGVEETTKVESVAAKDGKTMLQGGERGRAWSMVIDQQSGKMSATVADNSEAFVIFGACIAR